MIRLRSSSKNCTGMGPLQQVMRGWAGLSRGRVLARSSKQSGGPSRSDGVATIGGGAVGLLAGGMGLVFSANTGHDDGPERESRRRAIAGETTCGDAAAGDITRTPHSAEGVPRDLAAARGSRRARARATVASDDGFIAPVRLHDPFNYAGSSESADLLASRTNVALAIAGRRNESHQGCSLSHDENSRQRAVRQMMHVPRGGHLLRRPNSSTRDSSRCAAVGGGRRKHGTAIARPRTRRVHGKVVPGPRTAPRRDGTCMVWVT